ncbi:heparinase II/III domain-containing protein [Actinopolymorpha singaporensis]|uniref:Heparinase II/III-like protein n=1 Tax=Actinopolymorpha singaporensis TaxID=117157 RepID=A0A1H1TQG9_9ACTN|nr:heparinase II/III family protein [Actinopolymorpha singaporensis]SDS62394.1 Heparinase II/III-like protein [Actinopolymorpha singaporensis]
MSGYGEPVPPSRGGFQPSRRDVLRYGMLLGTAAMLPPLVPDPAAATTVLAAPTVAPALALADVPTKAKPTIYTDEMVAAARRNVEQYDWAKEARDAAVAKAEPLLAKGDDWLWKLVTGQGLPRSYAVNQDLGSPVTGKDIYRFGNYPWLADPIKQPWKLIDPSVPEDSGRPRIYPTNDFGAFYASGLDEHGNFDRARADRSLLVNELYPEKGPTWGVDDGFGWVDDHGAKWTFVPYYNHWLVWYSATALYSGAASIYNGLPALRDAFITTGDVRYAHAGLILLDRIADVYPSMDTTPYKRSDGYLHSDGLSGRGKVVGCIWETGLSQLICDAYDAFFPAIANADEADVVPFLSEKARQYGLAPKDSPAAIRVNIENGILRQVYPNVQAGRIRGNFGMHQRSVTLAGVVLDSPSETKEWIDFVFKTGSLGPPPEYRVSGGDVYRTLVDVVDRDGMGNEASPGYNRLWIGHMRGIADVLDGYTGYPAADLYEHPKFRKMFQGMHPLVMLGAYVPQIGDTGSTGAPGLFGSPSEFFYFFEKFGLPEYAQMAYLMNGNSTDNLYGNLFSPDVPGVQQRIRKVIAEHGTWQPPSENLTGYGIAMLRDGVEDKARDLWVYYGRTFGHGHLDALNLGMHGFGVDLLPDLGYPEFADASIRTQEWNQNTVAHNTVVVDKRPQAEQWVGTPHGFAAGDRVQLCDTSAPAAYTQTSTYRRLSAMVKVDDTDFYAFDVFRVVGGTDHHFSFHAAEGPATAEGLTLVDQPTGTYAGPDVPMPPDDAPYRSNASGFDWLDNVSRDTSPTGRFSVDWKVKDTWGVHDPDPNLHLRLTMLSEVDDVAICDGTPPRNKPGNPPKLRYLLAHRQAPAGKQLTSQFVSLIEPYVDRRVVRSVSMLPVRAIDGTIAAHEAAAVRVELTNGRVDHIVNSLRTDVMLKVELGNRQELRFRGSFGIYSTRGGAPEYAWTHGASFLGPLPQMQGPAAATGTLRDFTRDLSVSNQLTVKLDAGVPAGLKLQDSYAYVTVPQSTYARIAFPSRTRSQAGDFGALTQQITVDQATSHQLSVRVNDDFAGATAGYFFVQVLIDGAVVVERDVAGAGEWRVLTADVTGPLAGKSSAVLTLRLLSRKAVSNFGVAVMFDDVAISGTTVENADFEDISSPAWRPESNSPNFAVNPRATADTNARNAVYRVHGARFTDDTTVVLDIGDITTVRGYADPNDFGRGFRYDVAEGARVDIPYTREWRS